MRLRVTELEKSQQDRLTAAIPSFKSKSSHNNGLKIMAAWGTKTFEEDTANNWIQELIDSDDEREFLIESLSVDPGYIEADQAAVVLAASETLIALLDEPRDSVPGELVDWVGDNECADVSDLPEVALPALDKVLGEESELREIWADSGDFDEWLENVESMREIIMQLSQL